MKPDIQHAIEIIEEIRRQLGPAYAAYWVLPNTLLTLSGARAYCDGVFWDDDNKGLLKAWDKEIAEAVAVIKAKVAVVTADTGIREVRIKEKYASYELILEAGLTYVLDCTGLLESGDLQRLKHQPVAPELIDVMCKILRQQSDCSGFSNQTMHDVAFGILVGYPDKAILESVDKWQVDDPFAEPLVAADIRGAGYYNCPQPVYDYPRYLMNDPDIIKHERLWSKILRDYYTSDFHKSLESDKQFQQKLVELHAVR